MTETEVTDAEFIRAQPYPESDDYIEVRRDERGRIIKALARHRTRAMEDSNRALLVRQVLAEMLVEKDAEIARLREALKRIAKGGMVMSVAADYARQALEPESPDHD